MIKIYIFHKLFFFIFFFTYSLQIFSQDSKIIEIQQAGSITKDEFNFPGANILKKENNTRVHLFHEGALIKSNTSFFYPKKNFFSANGDIVFNQGDSLFLNCDRSIPVAKHLSASLKWLDQSWFGLAEYIRSFSLYFR